MAGRVPGTSIRRPTARSTPSRRTRRTGRRVPTTAARPPTSTRTSCSPAASSSSGRRVPRPSSRLGYTDWGGAFGRRPFLLSASRGGGRERGVTRRSLWAVAALVLVVAVLRPPEVWPPAAALVELLAAAALVLP